MQGNILQQIRKRDGRLVAFDEQKIGNAIYRALEAGGQPDQEQAQKLARRVHNFLRAIYKSGQVPTVENVQDVVETTLMDEGFRDAAKRYILYRAQHSKLRQTRELFASARELIDNYLDLNFRLVRERSDAAARGVFRASLVYLALLYAAMLIDLLT